MSARLDADGFDPDEPVIALVSGPHASPWHPAQPSSVPPTYNFCVLGKSGAGKTSFVHATCTRSFDQQWRQTRTPAQHFCRLEHEHRDVLVELIDTPAADSAYATSALLKPLVWYEKRRGETEPKADPRFSSPLATHPIAEDRKRMGFLVVGDVSTGLAGVHELVDAIFDRCEADSASKLPVAVVIVGTKADHLRREAAASLRDDIHRRYNGHVGFVATSALAYRSSCAEALHEALRRLRDVPSREQIHAARFADLRPPFAQSRIAFARTVRGIVSGGDMPRQGQDENVGGRADNSWFASWSTLLCVGPRGR